MLLSAATLATCAGPTHVFTLNANELVMPWCWFFGGMLFVKSTSSGRPSPLNDDPVDVYGCMVVCWRCRRRRCCRRVQSPCSRSRWSGRGEVDKGFARGFLKGKKAVGGSVVAPWQNDVSVGRNVWFFPPRCGGLNGFW